MYQENSCSGRNREKGSSYTPRDTWTNIGLDMDIDIRKMSSGLGHSTVAVIDKHYAKTVVKKTLDESMQRLQATPMENLKANLKINLR